MIEHCRSINTIICPHCGNLEKMKLKTLELFEEACTVPIDWVCGSCGSWFSFTATKTRIGYRTVSKSVQLEM